MKTKILLFPLFLLVILVMIIWFIIPTWKDLQAQKKVLQESEARLEKMQTKKQAAEKLKGELNNMTADKEAVEEFIPKKINDEEIMNSFIGYANMQGDGKSLRMANFSVQRGKSDQPVNIPDMDSNMKNLPVMMQQQIIKPTSLNVTIGISGSYEGLKEFFSKISNLKREFDFTSFKISRASTTDASLSANVELAFNYLDEYKPEKIDESLLTENFDLGAVKMIKDRGNVDIMKVEANPQGRTNPFLP